ncbi:uncharacterized protein METZ01_LOCUS134952 [marine metagenome]|uniref:Uncharacterized protein n=1 Tax=marine metagenome TaxID=408172 RepID=A0A381YYK3_9ZZZZ
MPLVAVSGGGVLCQFDDAQETQNIIQARECRMIAADGSVRAWLDESCFWHDRKLMEGS